MTYIIFWLKIYGCLWNLAYDSRNMSTWKMKNPITTSFLLNPFVKSKCKLTWLKIILAQFWNYFGVLGPLIEQNLTAVMQKVKRLKKCPPLIPLWTQRYCTLAFGFAKIHFKVWSKVHWCILWGLWCSWRYWWWCFG